MLVNDRNNSLIGPWLKNRQSFLSFTMQIYARGGHVSGYFLNTDDLYEIILEALGDMANTAQNRESGKEESGFSVQSVTESLTGYCKGCMGDP